MANTNLLWRGAIEPAETSPSGNENKSWRGAVEPAGAVEVPRANLTLTGYAPSTLAVAAAASSGGPSVIDGITRPVTGNITRLVTERSFFY